MKSPVHNAMAQVQETVAMTVGTAGHIDHGKTMLVKLLTGCDCDRLPGRTGRVDSIDDRLVVIVYLRAGGDLSGPE